MHILDFISSNTTMQQVYKDLPKPISCITYLVFLNTKAETWFLIIFKENNHLLVS